MQNEEIGTVNVISQNEKARSFLSTLIDSAVIIAMITGVLYLVSFFYLKGFYSYYGLIDISIDFSIFRILKICLEIFCPLLSWVLIYSLLAISVARLQDNPTIQTYFTVLWIYLLCMLFLRTARYESDKSQRIFYTILGFGLLVLFILGFIIIRLLPKKIKNKFSDFLDKEKQLPLSYIYKIVYFLGSILVIVNFIPKYGFNEAANKKDYLYDAQNERVLIYQDSEKSIFLPRNSNGSFEKKYIIVSSEDLSNVILEHYNQPIQFGNIESDVVDDETIMKTREEIQ